jgi:hypothetical protein
MKKVAAIISLLFLMNSNAQAQSGFEYLFPAPESGSEFGRFCVQHKEKLIVSTVRSSFQIYGGAIPFESFATGTNIWILAANGNLESESNFHTVSDFNWGAQSEIFIVDDEVLLPYNKVHSYVACDSTIGVLISSQKERGLFLISENNEEIENISFNDPCENEGGIFKNYENSIFTSIYRNSENEIYFEQRDESFNIIQDVYIGESGFEWNNVFKTNSGYYTFSQSGINLIKKEYDSNFNFLSEQSISLISENDALIDNLGYLSIDENEYLFYYQYIDDIPYSYIVSFDTNGSILHYTESSDIRIKDITAYGSSILSLSNKHNYDCIDNVNNMKIDLLDEELNTISTGYYGLEYVTGYDISISNDNHFIVIGSAQKPAYCYAEDETTPYQSYILKSPLSTLDTPEIQQNKIRISPNPSTNSFNINSIHMIQEVIIKDVSGKELKRLKALRNQVDISKLVDGIYLIGIRIENVWHWEKLVKQ